ncbi:Hypothetical predicted protein [Xyrichtys novacula]|uniref:Uncharacterized protein n=1 Tax=Xyrichtys novacula TaxID=13765 RepID=A0AAV1H213_XYRNO|nr:Hypothetical predicted protein [Xyrichtys novacula]
MDLHMLECRRFRPVRIMSWKRSRASTHSKQTERHLSAHEGQGVNEMNSHVSRILRSCLKGKGCHTLLKLAQLNAALDYKSLINCQISLGNQMGQHWQF